MLSSCGLGPSKTLTAPSKTAKAAANTIVRARNSGSERNRNARAAHTSGRFHRCRRVNWSVPAAGTSDCCLSRSSNCGCLPPRTVADCYCKRERWTASCRSLPPGYSQSRPMRGDPNARVGLAGYRCLDDLPMRYRILAERVPDRSCCPEPTSSAIHLLQADCCSTRCRSPNRGR